MTGYQEATGAASSAAGTEPRSVVVLRPTRGFSLDLREIWAYRELLAFLVWRDIKVRYKQTVLGASWALIQPVMSMIIFSVIFGRFAKIPSDGLPYPIFVFAGLLPWTYFAQSLSLSSLSIVSSASLVTKIYFPRLIIPLASVAVPIVDFFLSFTVLIGMMAYYGIVPSWHIVFFPFFLLFALATALGTGLWLSALNVRYRDVPFIIPFIAQLWMYASPVIYPVSLVHGHWRLILSLNPMVGVIDGFRWALLGQGQLRVTVLLTSVVVGVIMVLSGLNYFRRVERYFADII